MMVQRCCCSALRQGGALCLDTTRLVMQGAALLTQYAADNIEVEGNGLQSSFYLAFGATGALFRHERCCLPTLPGLANVCIIACPDAPSLVLTLERAEHSVSTQSILHSMAICSQSWIHQPVAFSHDSACFNLLLTSKQLCSGITAYYLLVY